MDRDEETALLPRIADQTEQIIRFTTTWRGYRREEVEAYVTQAEAEIKEHRDRVRALERALADAESRITEVRQEAAQWRERYEQSTPPFEELGERIAQILTLAEQEAQSRRNSVQSQVKKTLDDAERRAKEMVAAAQERAKEVSSQAEKDLKKREADTRERLQTLEREHDVLLQRLTEIRAALAQIPGLQPMPGSGPAETPAQQPQSAGQPASHPAGRPAAQRSQDDQAKKVG